MPKTRWYHSAETSTSVTFATRSLRELTLMGIMYRQMIRWFVTKIYQVQAYTFCIFVVFPVQALDDSSIDRPSRNSASAVFPATSAASGERKPGTLTFTPIGVFL